MLNNQSIEYRARTAREHSVAWKRKWIAWSIGLPSWFLQVFAEYYSKWPISGALRIFEPLGITISILALLGTVAALQITIGQINEERVARAQDRQVRLVTLLALTYERIEEARRQDNHLVARKKHTRAGQVSLLEELVRQGMYLEDFNGSFVNFSSNDPIFEKIGWTGQGIHLPGGEFFSADFAGSNLGGAVFTGAELSFARFEGAFIHGGNFKHSTLRKVNFSGANIIFGDFAYADVSGADFNNTNLSSASFLNVKNLTQLQLDSACTVDGRSPQHLPNEDSSGNKLVWHPREC